MNEACLSGEVLAQYGSGALPPRELVRVLGHLRGCPACRGRVRTLQAGGWHLDYELLEAYADGRANEVDREIVDTHTEDCLRCAGDLRQMMTLAAQLRLPEPAPVRRWWRSGPWPWALAGAVAALCVGVATLALWKPAERREVAERVSSRSEPAPAAPRPAREGDPFWKFDVKKPDTMQAWSPGQGAAETLLDEGGLRITIDANGKLSPVAGWPDDAIASVEAVVRASAGTAGVNQWITPAPGAAEPASPSHLWRGSYFAQAAKWAQAEAEFAALVRANPQSRIAALLLERTRMSNRKQP